MANRTKWIVSLFYKMNTTAVFLLYKMGLDISTSDFLLTLYDSIKSESKFSWGFHYLLVLKNPTALLLQILRMHLKIQMTVPQFGNAPKGTIQRYDNIRLFNDMTISQLYNSQMCKFWCMRCTCNPANSWLTICHTACSMLYPLARCQPLSLSQSRPN